MPALTGAPPAELSPRLEHLLRAAVKISGAAWALIVLEGHQRPVAALGLDLESAETRALAAALLAPPPHPQASFSCPVLGPGGDRLGVFGLGGGGSAGLPENLTAALEELCALAGFGVALEYDGAARDRERAGLSAELDHRVKNVLAAVQSVANQSAKRAVSLDGFLKAFSGRLKAMASAHELLTATRWRGAWLHDLAAAELASLAPGQMKWEGDEIFLNPRAASALSLALHELAINALRHGALASPRGMVRVRWARAPGGGFTVEWIESGGDPASPPAGRGFGRALIEEVTGRELDGEASMEFSGSGLRARITAGPRAMVEPGLPPVEPMTGRPDRPGVSIEPAPRPRGSIRGLHVLVVEDAALLAWELDAGLTEAGAVVVGVAADVEEALALIDIRLDAAVLDCNLNGDSVRPVAEALAARGTPFLFATGYGENQGAPEGFDAPIIRKPYDVTEIIATLIDLTGRRG